MQYVAYRVFAMECVVFAISKVSIHAPARGAIFSNRLNFVRYCFNSRTREGCDAGEMYWNTVMLVSIHAPARGAITGTGAVFERLGFNSRTREGCDLSLEPDRGFSRFQFTHPRGVRCWPECERLYNGVSIHAPARGAISNFVSKPSYCGFQFTHPRGVRYLRAWVRWPECVSIHAPARGAIGPAVASVRSAGFNSRTREGCDVQPGRHFAYSVVSIHAPARGAIFRLV